MKKICCIGHITKDRIVTPQQDICLFGGTAYYFAHAICSLNPESGLSLVTSVADPEMAAVGELQSRGVEVTALRSRCSVFFENRYEADQNRRTQRVLAKADPFRLEDLRQTDADIFHLGSLLTDDFPAEAFPLFASKGILSVDAQGYLREVDGEQVRPVDWKDKRECLRYVDVLKVNEFEIESLTGTSEVRRAAAILHDWGVKEVCITLGSYGSVLFDGNCFYDVPAFPVDKIVDATGCGDTYSAGYLYKRACGAGIAESGCFAAAMSSLKLRRSGPFHGTEKDVDRLVGESGLRVEVEKLY